ncbi:MAG: V8-like Glu-specific endopeptidase [Loktanella salsilacus]|jgi:V8-like Glu-specific endopeptidase|nr:trypsin-like peptidase domain-containing protein [Alphaproteobacteria bacterium]MBU1836254.1 trypsin-like peptidase domain-containing protein [Alphaproteobacteria bacterium]
MDRFIRQGMRHFLALVMALWASLAAAQDTNLQSLDTGESSRGWQSVGRLDIAGSGFCTASLISQTMIITAAHCVYADDGSLIPAKNFTFLAGLRDDRAMATRAVIKVTPHPDYRHHGEKPQDGAVAVDLAVLELERPVRLPSLTPYGIGPTPTVQADVAVVSYARDRANAASLQRVCHVLDQSRGVLMMSCSADFGASGAPVFWTQNGQSRIVAIVSAMGTSNGKQVSLAVAAASAIDAVLIAHRSNQGQITQAPQAPQPRFTSSGTRNDTGAKFVRP